jgi:predicted small lipoprotein YifL
MRYRFGIVILALAFLTGCGNKENQSVVPAPQPSEAQQSPQAPQDDNSAITAAIEQHVRDNKGINMSAMDLTVGKATINGDQAQAEASFRVKQGGATMEMTYFLERHANRWIVERSQPSGGQFSHPPMDAAHSPAKGAPPSASLPDLTGFTKSQPPTKEK